MGWDENRIRTYIREIFKKRNTTKMFFKNLQDTYRDSSVEANATLKTADELMKQYPDFKPLLEQILQPLGKLTTRVYNDLRFLYCVLEEMELIKSESVSQQQDAISQTDREALDWLKKYIKSAKSRESENGGLNGL